MEMLGFNELFSTQPAHVSWRKKERTENPLFRFGALGEQPVDVGKIRDLALKVPPGLIE
jgi:hypothetical protein